VSLQSGRPTQRVFQVLTRLRSQPDALLAIQPIMPRKHIRVDTPALGIQSVGFRLGQGSGKLHGSQHRASLLSSVRSVALLFRTSNNGNWDQAKARSPPGTATINGERVQKSLTRAASWSFGLAGICHGPRAWTPPWTLRRIGIRQWSGARTPSSLRLAPRRWRNLVLQQLLHAPEMIGQPTRHGGGLSLPAKRFWASLLFQCLMSTTEIVGVAHQIHFSPRQLLKDILIQ
jgi:hypothetical protein